MWIWWWKIHPTDPLGRLISDVSRVHWVFQASQHHAPSLRWPSQGWSGPDLCPSSITPRITLLCPQPPEGSFCCFCYSPEGCFLHQPTHAQPGIGSVERVASKAPAAFFCWMAICSPALFLALLHKTLVLGSPPFNCLLHAVFPGHGQFYQGKLFRGLWQNDNVWSQRCHCNVWNLSYLPRSTISCQSCAGVSRPPVV